MKSVERAGGKKCAGFVGFQHLLYPRLPLGLGENPEGGDKPRKAPHAG